MASGFGKKEPQARLLRGSLVCLVYLVYLVCFVIGGSVQSIKSIRSVPSGRGAAITTSSVSRVAYSVYGRSAEVIRDR
jgi:hypothetical protein